MFFDTIHFSQVACISIHTVGARGPSPLHHIETLLVTNDTVEAFHEMPLHESNSNSVCDYSDIWNLV
jgi:hypothetical protein